jgi:hypothetical protein
MTFEVAVIESDNPEYPSELRNETFSGSIGEYRGSIGDGY